MPSELKAWKKGWKVERSGCFFHINFFHISCWEMFILLHRCIWYSDKYKPVKGVTFHKHQTSKVTPRTYPSAAGLIEPLAFVLGTLSNNMFSADLPIAVCCGGELLHLLLKRRHWHKEEQRLALSGFFCCYCVFLILKGGFHYKYADRVEVEKMITPSSPNISQNRILHFTRLCFKSRSEESLWPGLHPRLGPWAEGPHSWFTALL